MKTCHYCFEEIKEKAIKCKHCQSDLTMTNKQIVRKNTDIIVRRLIVLNLLFICSILSLVTVYKIFEPSLVYSSQQKDKIRINKQLSEQKREREAYERSLEQSRQWREERFGIE